MATPGGTDTVRAVLVVVTAVAQVISSPLTTLALGPSSNTGAISDANRSPVTPAGYAFAIWGLIYLGCLALAVYQLLPSQRHREVHRRSGWWLVAAFSASTIWVPIFGSRLIWVSEIVIVGLVALLLIASWQLTLAGPAESTAERWLLRLPVTVYLGWAAPATAAGFATTLRSLGMAESGREVTAIGIALIVAVTAFSVVVINQLTAVAGFTFTATWALLAVAIGTEDGTTFPVALVALVLVVGALAARVGRSSDRINVLVG
jgi:benzodiazapine receptor